ncbi:hypothetical protein YS110_04910 [Acidovorax sp. YS12]|nr:hypothetical protein YS110_04910 [Acidovorax sp. YS12]
MTRGKALPAVVLALALAAISSAGAAQPLSIRTGCGGALGAPMTQIASPYHQAVAALRGSGAGWCAMAAEQDATTPEGAALWEFVSAAYVLHALQGRKQISPEQRAALQRVLARIPGLGEPPSRRQDIDTALYVHARTLAAEDSGAAQFALDGLQQHAPAVYRTLVRRSTRWGDADDN